MSPFLLLTYQTLLYRSIYRFSIEVSCLVLLYLFGKAVIPTLKWVYKRGSGHVRAGLRTRFADFVGECSSTVLACMVAVCPRVSYARTSRAPSR
jgi:hypothetical protein